MGAFFTLVVLTAAIVEGAIPRRAAAVAVAVAAICVAVLIIVDRRLTVASMDAEWLAVLVGKGYLFPTGWPAWIWIAHLAEASIILWAVARRRALRLLKPGEMGLAAGCLALVAFFVASLPFIAMRSAFAVQLQTSRVFWIVEFVALVYLVWIIVEAAGGAAARSESRRPNGRAIRPAASAIRRWAAVALCLAAAGRGVYVMAIEHPERPLIQMDLPDDAWTDVLRWARSTSPAAHFLVDPGHAWKYGASVRTAAARDVYLEEVKDSAMAIYQRETARRVAMRLRDIGDFGALTPESARRLAQVYDIDYLVAETSMDLPVVYRNSRFVVYQLRESPPR
jgi:hypothetical protein